MHRPLLTKQFTGLKAFSFLCFKVTDSKKVDVVII